MRFCRTVIIHEVGRPHLGTVGQIDGEQLAPRAETEYTVAGQQRCGDRTIVGSVMARVSLSDFVAPDFFTALDVEGGDDVLVSSGVHRDDATVADRDRGIPRPDGLAPTDREAGVAGDRQGGISYRAVEIRPTQSGPVDVRLNIPDQRAQSDPNKNPEVPSSHVFRLPTSL